MKSDYRRDRFDERDINLTPYADLPLFALENQGEVQLNNRINMDLINDFLIRVKNIYFAKRNQMLKDKEKIIVPNPKN